MARFRSINTAHLPSLDGLRAISIALVLLGHLSGTHGFVRLNFGVGDYAHLGVVVFFVISGFLITRLLLAEHNRAGHISLKLFYVRRSVRLFPASYAFIFCIFALQMAGAVHLRTSDFLHAVTYTVNYLHNSSWEIGHLWSLSVEEQFYLVWPVAFLMLNPRRATFVAAVVILLGPVARLGTWFFLTGTPYRDLEMFPVVADSLATGCVLAQTSGWLERREWYRKLFQRPYSFALLTLILLANRYMGYTVVFVFGTSLVNICLAILIHRCIYCNNGRVGAVLNWTPIALIGMFSYSLYLWQQLFLNRNSTAWVNSFPQNLVLGIAVALLSYYGLEKPLLSLRHRLRT